MEVRVRVYDKGDEDENVGDNIVSSHYMSNEDGDRVLLVEREDVFGISRRFEMFDLRLITKCEIQGGDEKVTDLRYLTTSGHSGSLFLSAKHSKLFKSSIERAKKNHDSADDNIFDVTIEAFCRDRKTGRGGEFCVIAISSLRAIIASDFETHSIHEIKNVSADSSKFQIVNKDGTSSIFLPNTHQCVQRVPPNTHVHTLINRQTILIQTRPRKHKKSCQLNESIVIHRQVERIETLVLEEQT